MEQHRIAVALLSSLVAISVPSTALAEDYFLTLAGGYQPSGNQASLEANVLFYQQLLTEVRETPPTFHEIYFADGTDSTPDLQVEDIGPNQRSELFELLAALHWRGRNRVVYRNHEVPNVNGSLSPTLVEGSFERVAKLARPGDRVIVYVTAHGNRGSRNDEFNTTIDCWNGDKIYARDLQNWISAFDPQVHVITVMAQCYCGGFARMIFNDLDPSSGLVNHVRVGFFAQQHDLAAAGCRPDIANEEEFSSYFWGAVAGRSRNGNALKSREFASDGQVSFSEAYAYALVECNSIDIPLRSSDVLLRQHSKIKNYEMDRRTDDDAENELQDDYFEGLEAINAQVSEDNLAGLDKSLEELIRNARPATRNAVEKLADKLNILLTDSGLDIVKAYSEFEMERIKSLRNQRRGGFGRSRSGRRELVAYIDSQWPELADREDWNKSPLLNNSQSEQILADIKSTEEYLNFQRVRNERETANEDLDDQELRGVKMRRLIDLLESIVLEQNLNAVAPSEIVTYYQAMVRIEDSTL